MLVNTRNGTLLLAVLAVACVATSCLPDNAYESCRLPPDEKLRCQGDDKTINCMVQHPACPDNYCITWQGGDSFCTQQCTKSSDCPEDGCCVPFILGCTTVNGVEKCPTLCVQRTQIEDGVCPSSVLPTTDADITVQQPDLATTPDTAVSIDLIQPE